MILEDPVKIESKSFEIIKAALGAHAFNNEEIKIVTRVIHATADLEYKNNITFKSNPVDAAVKAIKSGCNILADVGMVMAGINKGLVNSFQCSVESYINDPEIKKEAKREGTTRSVVSIRKGSKWAENGIIAIGNAPTALMEVIKLIREGKINPVLVIGVPVGFVGAEEIKEELLNINIPLITCRGKKGGSPVCAAILNALLKIASERQLQDSSNS